MRRCASAALVLGLVVLFAWAVSAGARPWRSGGDAGVAQRVVVTVLAFAAGLALLAVMLGSALYAFGARLG